MAISLLVLLVPVLLLIGGYQVVSGRTQPVPTDPAEALAAAERAGLETVSPQGLDSAWVPISAVFQPEPAATVRVGYVTPSGDSLQVLQTGLPSDQVLTRELTEPRQPGGEIELGGVLWQQYRSGSGKRALVRLEPDRTVLVFGSAAIPELHEFAAALR
jgi:hypothetical protein